MVREWHLRGAATRSNGIKLYNYVIVTFFEIINRNRNRNKNLKQG